MKIRKIKIPLLLIKILHFEYWHFSVFYIPMYFYGIFLGLKARSATYFTATNPRMHTGGAIRQPKNKILNDIDKRYLPTTLYFTKETKAEKVYEILKKSQLSFPIIIKPNIGERGKNVEKINNEQELFHYLNNNYFDMLIQEFVDYPLEFGLLYYRFPNKKSGHISSLVQRELLSMTGNGKNTLAQLVENYDRARFQKKKLQQKFSSIWNKPLVSNKKLLLEPIGNHCRGTKFLNVNHLINDHLVAVFDAIASTIPSYYYGRFDLKVPCIEDFYAGKNIKIVELNGVNSEPAHIYDPKTSIFKAYSVMFKHMNIIYKIATQNHRDGIAYLPFHIFLKELYKHFYQE